MEKSLILFVKCANTKGVWDFYFWLLKSYCLIFKSSILKMMGILLNGYDLKKDFGLKRNFI